MPEKTRKKNQLPLFSLWQKLPFCHICVEKLGFKFLLTSQEEIVFESVGFKSLEIQIIANSLWIVPKCCKMFQNVSKCFKMFQMFQIGPNCSKMFQIVQNCWKGLENVTNCCKTWQMILIVQKCCRILQNVANYWNCCNMLQNVA